MKRYPGSSSTCRTPAARWQASATVSLLLWPGSRRKLQLKPLWARGWKVKVLKL